MLAYGGRIAVIGLQQGARGELDMGKLMDKRAMIMSSRLRRLSGREKAVVVSGARAFAMDVTPHVHATVPLEEARRAHKLMDEPATVGKIVLTL